MKTVGNDLVRHQLHENRKWYLGLGILLVLFGFILLAALPFATLSVVFIFGVLGYFPETRAALMVGAVWIVLLVVAYLLWVKPAAGAAVEEAPELS